jgi:alkanesulfonate monooxygenase SsuD/methylene tetrahydromethanopterin reductase-like flavin-dependent oxidoreductase (luciferase family)
VRYCLNLPAAGACGDAASLGELAAVAEASGWDAVLLEDYIVYQNRQDLPTYDPWVSLAAMALRTGRIRIGTELTPLVRRRPWKVARETVTLDHLCGGRLTLAVGLGLSTDLSFCQFDELTNNRERATALDEALDVLVGLWSGAPFSYSGRHYRVGEITFLPTPVQQPRIPIWIGGAFPNRGPLRRAARWDGACLYRAAAAGQTDDTGQGLSPDDIRAIRTYIDAHRPADAGPFDIVAGGQQRPADWYLQRTRIRSAAEAGATWWVEWLPPSDCEAMHTAIAHGPLRID